MAIHRGLLVALSAALAVGFALQAVAGGPGSTSAAKAGKDADPVSTFRQDVARFDIGRAYGLLAPKIRVRVPLAVFAGYVLEHGASMPVRRSGRYVALPEAAVSAVLGSAMLPGPSGPAAPELPVPVPSWLLGLYTWDGIRYGVPWTVLAAQGWVESGYNPRAVTRDADGSIDRGLAQINSKAHADVTAAEAFNPWFAVTWQARDLRSLYERYGNWPDALSAYNSGRPLSSLRGPMLAKERAYAASILSLAQALAGDVPVLADSLRPPMHPREGGR